MASVYKQFLASPSSSYLSDKASLHYVTTTTSVCGPTEIIKHLNTLQKQVKIKKQELLNLVDGQSVIAAEIDTTLEFQTSGGAYLPGLDDNFLSDRVANLSIVSLGLCAPCIFSKSRRTAVSASTSTCRLAWHHNPSNQPMTSDSYCHL